MSTGNTSTPGPDDEAGIERVVREILFPLDHRLEQATNWGCSVFLLVVLPLAFFSLWIWAEWGLVGSAVTAVVGSFALWVAQILVADNWLASAAVKTFNNRFPEGHPSRPMAIQMLSEMECPNRAQEKLREAIRRLSS